jgi:replication factor C large subunit
MMWIEKYRPVQMGEILGNEIAKKQVTEWLKKWTLKSKPILIYGEPGTGKTTLVHVLANKSNYNLVELNTSDQRTEAKINESVGRAAQSSSLDQILNQKQGTILFFDEIDGISGREDFGGVSAILKIIKNARIPIILVANNISDRKISNLVKACHVIQLHLIRPPILNAFLHYICKQENIQVDDSALKVITKTSRGDVRSALNDLQIYSTYNIIETKEVSRLISRTESLNLQEVLIRLIKTKDLTEARRIMNASQIPLYRDEILLTLHDNLPRIYTNQTTELAEAYQFLSYADIILKRIRDPTYFHWHLIPYLLEVISLIFISNPPKTSPESLSYPPFKILMMARTRQQRFLRDQIAIKIKKKCHLAIRTASQEILPYLKIITKASRKQGEQIQRWLDFTDEEITYLKT